MTDRHLHLGILEDSGPPEGSIDYTTIVLLHGYAWHSGIFSKLIPLAAQNNARVVLVNRRDYPGSTPYTLEERAELLNAAIEASTNPLAAQERLGVFMKERAREVYEFLVHFVADNKIPPARPEANTGGIVIGGWSLGTHWMTALLANVASFPVHEVELSRYIRRVIFYDPSETVLGFPPIPNAPAPPLNDPSIPTHDVMTRFAIWCSAYYENGESPDKYQLHGHLVSPPPTYNALTEEERANTFHPIPGDPRGGSDYLLMLGRKSGISSVIRKNALRLPPANAQCVGDAWRDVEVRHLWCDRSPWVIPWAAENMRREHEEENNAGLALRNVTFFRVRGANHFVHWDEPDRAMNAILAVAPDAVDRLTVEL